VLERGLSRRTKLDGQGIRLGRRPREQGRVDLHAHGARVGRQVAEEQPRGARAHGEWVELGVHLGDEARDHDERVLN
jgi:hypothetical protein